MFPTESSHIIEPISFEPRAARPFAKKRGPVESRVIGTPQRRGLSRCAHSSECWERDRDPRQFDRLTRTVSVLVTCRSLGGAVGLAPISWPDSTLPKSRNKPKVKHNQFGCVNVGNACTKADQCCSGICEGNTRKKVCQAHNAGRLAATWKCLARIPTDPTRDVVSRPPARALLRRRRRPMLRMQQGQRVSSVLWQACGVRALSFLPERDGRIHDGLHRSRPGVLRSEAVIAVIRGRCGNHSGTRRAGPPADTPPRARIDRRRVCPRQRGWATGRNGRPLTRLSCVNYRVRHRHKRPYRVRLVNDRRW